MALDRSTLRDDLVSVIAAGRELGQEHDYALADVFLNHAHDALLREVTPPPTPVKAGPIAALVGAGFLALAALLSPYFMWHGYHDGDAQRQTVVVPGPYDHGGFQPPNFP